MTNEKDLTKKINRLDEIIKSEGADFYLNQKEAKELLSELKSENPPSYRHYIPRYNLKSIFIPLFSWIQKREKEREKQ